MPWAGAGIDTLLDAAGITLESIGMASIGVRAAELDCAITGVVASNPITDAA